jgi:hypothetical protein
MTWRPPPLPPGPAATAAAVRAAFPTGHLSVDRRTAVGTLDADQLLADLSAEPGRPLDVAPWRLALVLLRPSIEGLTDRQAAAAVRRGLDGPYALSLEWTDPGVDCTLVPDVRPRRLAPGAAQRLLESLLDRLQRPRRDQRPGPPTDRFPPRPGGGPHAPPLRMRAGSPASSPPPAR